MSKYVAGACTLPFPTVLIPTFTHCAPPAMSKYVADACTPSFPTSPYARHMPRLTTGGRREAAMATPTSEFTPPCVVVMWACTISTCSIGLAKTIHTYFCLHIFLFLAASDACYLRSRQSQNISSNCLFLLFLLFSSICLFLAASDAASATWVADRATPTPEGTAKKMPTWQCRSCYVCVVSFWAKLLDKTIKRNAHPYSYTSAFTKQCTHTHAHKHTHTQRANTQTHTRTHTSTHTLSRTQPHRNHAYQQACLVPTGCHFICRPIILQRHRIPPRHNEPSDKAYQHSHAHPSQFCAVIENRN